MSGKSLGQTSGKAIHLTTKPIFETTAQIMEREKLHGPKLPIRVAKSYETEHEIDREHLKQNSRSLASATWPPMVNDVPSILGKGSTQPYFGVSVNFGGPQSSESPYVPPDSNGDVSLSTVIVQANGRIKSYDRLGNAGAMNVAADTFCEVSNRC